ncbi:serine hydrolase [Granulicella tundricola]|uniref:Peptidase S11 D-alanyl-D-alanine carboxypeptidase 1 n=1 Tax=Granulicella tundricola (strain ATCC BAA-1859 / DSM 23138 / MP5ACTX9) TaxID=1198114 RepID=E8X686_GRATM|nr:serine hydrolase [Granulicella tundricola]ADW70970.1 peptidase S11 D-alanyl-D-alanine carboxypeptidase 1 [Granulicella tundricola MP5ACTX9]
MPGPGWYFVWFLMLGSAVAQSTPLEGRLREIAAAHHGKVAVFAENLKTGETVGLDADKVVQTASVIKLTILFDAMEQVRAGKVKLDDAIVLKKSGQVGGSGILQLFDTPLTLTLRDVLMLMITQSDNTGTNLAIDKLGLANINGETRALGLKNTWLYKKVFTPATEPMPADQKIYGLGKTTGREMAKVLERIYKCQFITAPKPGDEALCTEMLGMLNKQGSRDGVPRYLNNDSAVGNKTGALEAVRADAGIVSTKAGPVVMCLFTYENADRRWTADNEGEVTIAKMSKAIVEAWSPEGMDAAGYKVSVGK